MTDIELYEMFNTDNRLSSDVNKRETAGGGTAYFDGVLKDIKEVSKNNNILVGNGCIKIKEVCKSGNVGNFTWLIK